MREECAVAFPSPWVVSETAGVTGIEGVDTKSDVSCVSPIVVAVEGGAVNICKVVRGVRQTLEEDEVLVSPEWDVSGETRVVHLCPLGEDEEVDVLTWMM